jgi:hypothetical protein
VSSSDKKKSKKASQRPSLSSRILTRGRQFWDGGGRYGAGVVGVALGVGLTFSLVVFPLRDYFEQRSMVSEKTAEFETLADANEQLQLEVNSLKTPEGIRNAARAQLGYVLPGEQRLQMTQMPALPTDLPPQWPYSMVKDILRVRAESVVKSGDPLSPLAP